MELLRRIVWIVIDVKLTLFDYIRCSGGMAARSEYSHLLRKEVKQEEWRTHHIQYMSDVIIALLH
eukprot:scaffold2730_cov76-Skeletonema_dohrnii-CCMP3373.AAC.1